MYWLTALLVPVILGLLAKLFPYRSAISSSSIGFATLKAKYQKWETFAIVLLFIFIPLMTYLFGQLFSVLFDLILKKEAGIVYNILPEMFLWYVPGCMLSFALIGFPIMAAYKLILGKEKYEEYTLFTNIKSGFDGMKILRPMVWALGIIATIGIILLADFSIKIFDNRIVINNFLSLSEKAYTYDKIHSISFIKKVQKKNGFEPRSHYYIQFTDSSIWNTSIGLRDERRQDEIIKFLRDKSNVKIDTLEFDPE